MENKDPFKKIAVFLTVVLIGLGIYTCKKYIDYHNSSIQPSYSDTEKNQTLTSEKTAASENLPAAETEAPITKDVTEEKPEISILWDYTQKWGYSCLSRDEKEVYVKLFNAAKEEKAAVNVTSSFVKGENIKKIAQAVVNDNPQFLNFYEKIHFTYNAADVNQYMRLIKIEYRKGTGGEDLEAAAAEILSQAELLSDDYSRVKYIHDTVIRNCSYFENVNDESQFAYSAAGPLVYKRGVCEGYAKAFCYLVQSVGIPCFCVSGTAVNSKGQTDNHMWNVVQINGNWYNVDVTWDDPVAEPGSGALSYDYFLKGDRIYSNHFPEANLDIPSTPKDY